MDKFIQKGVLTKHGMYVQMKEEFQENEQHILLILEEINKFRSIQQTGDLFHLNDPNRALLRQSMLVRFPFMAKL